jgi:hypothetical protein
MADKTTCSPHEFTPEQEARILANTRARGMTFEVFLPESMADWLRAKIAAGMFTSPGEAAFVAFQDHLAPKLTTYEQAIYLYVFRHSRFLGLEEATIGFKSARNRMALDLGKANTPMSEGSVYQSLRSLEAKRAITILRTEHSGRLIRLHLPHEIPGLVPPPTNATAPDIETMDFFEVPENRLLILKREDYKCFYTLQRLDDKNFVVEHVISRPNGDNSYRNVVAASREINNRKGAMTAEDNRTGADPGKYIVFEPGQDSLAVTPDPGFHLLVDPLARNHFEAVRRAFHLRGFRSAAVLAGVDAGVQRQLGGAPRISKT